ncbi:MAG: polysaccharide biosynthesis protein [Bacteroidales bacterium]|nr:polysaccharide biosynthesis protein [Bacteroidales bacterium]
MNAGNPIRQLAGETAIYGLGTIVPRTLNYLLLTFFYTRIFQQGEYGVVTELYAYAAFLLVLLTYGMETTFFRFAETEDDKSRVYSTSLLALLVTSAAFILLTLLFSGDLATMIRYSSNREYIIYFGLIIGMDAFMSIPFASLRQQRKAFRFASLKIVNVFVNIVLNLFFLFLCPEILKSNPGSIVKLIYSPDIGVGYAFISNLVASVVTFALILPETFRVRLIFDSALFKKMLRYALPLLVIGLAGMINEVSDKIFLKYLWPDPSTALEQVGIYGASFRLAVLMTLFTQVFRYAAEPFFFAQAKESNSKEVYASVMKYFVIFGLFIFLGVMLYIDLVQFFIGRNFREGLHIVPIILMANLLLGIFYNLSIWYKLNNLTRYGAAIAVIGALTTIVLNVLLIPVIGYLGSAWAHLACYFVMVMISYFWGRRFLPVDYDMKRIGLYIFSALTVYAASIFLDPGHLPARLLINTLLFGVFAVMVFLAERKRFNII